MGSVSKIQWTDATWNPWHGCRKVSPGCKYCYMYRDKERYKQDPTMVLRSKTKFDEPLRWEEPKLIFTCSWSDFFIEEADAWRKEAWEIIRKTPLHTYQILTKRPERVLECLPEDWGESGYRNVWIGISVETQRVTNERIPFLSEIPAHVRFLSIEPILEPIKLKDVGENYFRPDNVFTEEKGRIVPYFARKNYSCIDWVIIGGESGNTTGKYKYRPAEIDWINSIIIECQLLKVPVFVKQLGTDLAKRMKLDDRHGGDINEWPKSLQQRQMPHSYIKLDDLPF